MKKLFLFTCILLCASFTYSQAIFLGGSLDDYEGIWRYENRDSNLVFTIKLKKGTRHPEREKYDCVAGTYSFIRNGVTVTDNMSQFQTITYVFGIPVRGDVYNDIYGELTLSFNDELYNKHTYSGTLSLLPQWDGTYKLRWVLKEDEGDFGYEPDEIIPPDGFSVPDNVVLVKIGEL